MKLFTNTLAAIIMFASFSVFAGPVNINQADAKTIAKSLNGIGLKKAQAIVQYRKDKGTFSQLSDMIKVKGIGKKIINKNKALILFENQKQS